MSHCNKLKKNILKILEAKVYQIILERHYRHSYLWTRRCGVCLHTMHDSLESLQWRLQFILKNQKNKIFFKISRCSFLSSSQCDTASLMPRGWCGGQDGTAEGGEGEVEGGWTSHVGPHQDLKSMRCKQ